MNDHETIWITAAIGSAIRKARETRGISQSALADLVNASFPQIADYEKGEQQMSLNRFFNIAAALGVTAAELFGE